MKTIALVLIPFAVSTSALAMQDPSAPAVTALHDRTEQHSAAKAHARAAERASHPGTAEAVDEAPIRVMPEVIDHLRSTEARPVSSSRERKAQRQ